MDNPEKNVAAQRRQTTHIMPSVELEMGMAYEFIDSLLVYFDYELQEKTIDFEVRKAWIENIRTSCPQDIIEGLGNLTLQANIGSSWAGLLGMAYDTPSPKDVPTFMAYLELLDPLEIRLYFLGYYQRNLRKTTPLDIILQAAENDEEALQQFLNTAIPDSVVAQERVRKLVSSNGAEMKETLIQLLWNWYEKVFQPQEAHISPMLERDLEAKRKLQTSIGPEKLIEQATNGLVYEPEAGIRKIVIVPAFLSRPWNVVSNHQDVKLLVYSIADESVMADHSIPSVQLIRLYQALADERRLRILKLLKTRSYSLQEISEEFGVAKSTMHHHLGLLRSAGLIKIGSDEKQYSLRPELLSRVLTLLEEFLNGS